MEKHILTPDKFDSDMGVRHTLRYGHGFAHEDLERAKGIVTDAITHVEHKTGKTGMRAGDLPTAMKFLREEHAEYRSLSDAKKQHFEEALKHHFGVVEPGPKEAE